MFWKIPRSSFRRADREIITRKVFQQNISLLRAHQTNTLICFHSPFGIKNRFCIISCQWAEFLYQPTTLSQPMSISISILLIFSECSNLTLVSFHRWVGFCKLSFVVMYSQLAHMYLCTWNITNVFFSSLSIIPIFLTFPFSFWPISS